MTGSQSNAAYIWSDLQSWCNILTSNLTLLQSTRLGASYTAVRVHVPIKQPLYFLEEPAKMSPKWFSKTQGALGFHPNGILKLCIMGLCASVW